MTTLTSERGPCDVAEEFPSLLATAVAAAAQDYTSSNGEGGVDVFPTNGLPGYHSHLPYPIPRRVRSITMDSEDAEQIITLPDLLYENPDQNTLIKLNTMRKAERFCDVTLKVGSRNLPAHRAVLACGSSYLFELFDAEESNGSNYYTLDDLDPECVEILVDYAYSGRLEVPRDHVKAVYKTATLLKMQQASDACSRFMAENLSTSNCLGTRSFANSHCDEDLTCKTDDYIQQNMETIVGTAEMNNLPTIQLEIIGVTTEELKDHGERHLSKMVVAWLEQALQERSFQALTEDRPVLYLTTDNNLRDCLDITADEDSSLSHVDLIQDYKKLGKLKKMTPVKAKGNVTEKVASRTNSQNGMKRLLSNEKLASFEKEWKVIASELVGDQMCFCLAMLEDRLTALSMCFRPYPTTPPPSLGDPTPNTSPRGSIAQGLEKQCSLQPLSPMLNPRCAHGTAIMNNKLVALGGYDRGECHITMEMYDAATNGWSELEPMKVGRGRFDVAMVQGKLYACGGSDGTKELRTVECYDPAEQKWSFVTNMSARRSNAGVSVLNNKLYVVGGWSGTSGMRDCEVYDPDTDKWEPIAKLNTGRSQAGVCAYDGKLVAIGGCDAWNPMNTVEMYDPEENKWIFLPPMNTNRRGVGAAVFKGKLYAVCGSDGQASLTTVEVYDAQSQSWSFGPALSVPRANVSVAVLGGKRMYAVGGFSGKAFLDTMEYLGQDSQEWCGFVPNRQESSTDDGGEHNLSSSPGSDKQLYGIQENGGDQTLTNGHGSPS